MSINFPAAEQAVLQRWNEIDAFQRQLQLSKGRKRYTFYDGPPFATGLPHYGHLLASTIKDVIPRYWCMKGYYVERRFGWDTHGLPIEHEIDKKLGISGREAVEKLGLAGYNQECRSIVMRLATEWRQTIERLGRWIDFDNDYKTMNPSFMESVWWVCKELFEKGQIYRDYKVMPYSTALGTPLSNFEAQENKKDLQEPAIVVAFPLISDPKTNLLIWTTTPWTLPSNIAVASHPDFEYVKIHDHASDRNYIFLESLAKNVYKDLKSAKYTVLEKIKGRDLEGLKYKPPFNYFYEDNKDLWFQVIKATYVTSDAGVGLVHTSPAFGQDDFVAASDAGLISAQRFPPNPVDDKGCYTSEIPDFQGQKVQSANKALISLLKESGLLVLNGQINHTISFCPRSDTPLINKAVSAWFVRVADIAPQMLENLDKTHWVPAFVKEKRFGNWIANARDWNISRNRFWGTPIPIWASDDFEELVCIGSVAELKERSGYTGELEDLHRDKVDGITIPSQRGKGVLHRIDEVFDCWFESGSMPYASQHYPFDKETKGHFEDSFPADFVAEGLDQTRGWFYTLTILGTHLFGTVPFKNCVVNGIVLADNGKKMSKRLKNYPDPSLVMQSFGADALRLYLITSPVVRAETLRFKESGLKEVVSKVLLPFWNSYNFFEAQAALLKKVEDVRFVFDPDMDIVNRGIMDRWILASCQSLLRLVDQEMAAYRLYTVVPALLNMIDKMTNWYIRFNRKRLKGDLGLESSIQGLNTLFEVLFFLCRTLAPFMPFLTDHIYQLLAQYLPKSLLAKDSRSIHFYAYPEVREELVDEVVERKIKRMQTIVELVRVSRERRTIGLKTPLRTLTVIHPDQVYCDDLRSLEAYICEELNVYNLELSIHETDYNVVYALHADWSTLGKKLRKDAMKIKNALPHVPTPQVKDFLRDKEIKIEGITLQEEDLIVRREIKSDETKQLEVNTDNDVLTILDVASDPDLLMDGVAREIVNRVQQLRKKAGYTPIDDLKVQYSVLDDPDNIGLQKVFASRASLLETSLKSPLEQYSKPKEETVAGVEEKGVVEEQQEVQKATFLLKLLHV